MSKDSSQRVVIYSRNPASDLICVERQYNYTQRDDKWMPLCRYFTSDVTQVPDQYKQWAGFLAHTKDQADE